MADDERLTVRGTTLHDAFHDVSPLPAALECQANAYHPGLGQGGLGISIKRHPSGSSCVVGVEFLNSP